VYGNAGDLDEQEKIAKEYKIPLIYDGAHAFGVRLNNKSIFPMELLAPVVFMLPKFFIRLRVGL